MGELGNQADGGVDHRQGLGRQGDGLVEGVDAAGGNLRGLFRGGERQLGGAPYLVAIDLFGNVDGELDDLDYPPRTVLDRVVGGFDMYPLTGGCAAFEMPAENSPCRNRAQKSGFSR